jgi:hypothetical protein
MKNYRYTLALGGHLHARETLRFESEGLQTRFYQTAAAVGPSGEPGMLMRSGSPCIVYRQPIFSQPIPLDPQNLNRYILLNPQANIFS